MKILNSTKLKELLIERTFLIRSASIPDYLERYPFFATRHESRRYIEDLLKHHTLNELVRRAIRDDATKLYCQTPPTLFLDLCRRECNANNFND